MTKPIGSSVITANQPKSSKPKPSAKIAKLAQAITTVKPNQEQIVQEFKQVAVLVLRTFDIPAKTAENTTNLMNKLKTNPAKELQGEYLLQALENCSQAAVEEKLVNAGLITVQAKNLKKLREALTWNTDVKVVQELLQKVEKTNQAVFIAALDGAQTKDVFDQILQKMLETEQQKIVRDINQKAGKSFTTLQQVVDALQDRTCLFGQFVARSSDKEFPPSDQELQFMAKELSLYPFSLVSPEKENLDIFMTAIHTGCPEDILLAILQRDGGVVMNIEEIKIQMQNQLAPAVIQELLVQAKLSPTMLKQLGHWARTAPGIPNEYQTLVDTMNTTADGAVAAVKKKV